MNVESRVTELMKASAIPVTAKHIAIEVGIDYTTACKQLRRLHKRGRINICGFVQPTSGGNPTKLWFFGAGDDAEYTKVDRLSSMRKSYHKRKEQVIEKYGFDAWKKMRVSRKAGGSDCIVIDGKTVYRRKTHKCNRNKEQEAASA